MADYVLGLDGGGTKTLVQAMDTAGNPLFRLKGDALNLNSEGADRVRDTVQGLLEQAFAQAGADHLAAVCIGAAGVSNPIAEQVLRQGVCKAGFEGPVCITGDHIAALTGALGQPKGIILIAGTGSICAGRGEDGREARAGGRGHLIDDEGSGYAMGRDILRAVVRAEDGRGPATCLTEALYQAWSISSMEEIVSRVYSPLCTKRTIAALACLLPAAAEQRDPAALAIYSHAAEELAQLVAAVAHRLELTNPELALAGGVLTKDGFLQSQLSEKLKPLLLGITLTLPRQDAAFGAAQLAWDLIRPGKSKVL